MNPEENAVRHDAAERRWQAPMWSLHPARWTAVPAVLGYARNIFVAQGLILMLTGLYAGLLQVLALGLASATWLLLPGVALITGLGLLSYLSGRGMRTRRWRARPVVLVGSLASLPLFPFGTLAGLAGLYWCSSENARRAEALAARQRHGPRPGAATNQWVQRLLPLAEVLLVFGSLLLVKWWGQQHGLDDRNELRWLVELIACEWIVVLCHELGHWAAGALVQMRLVGLAIGPVLAERERGRWRFRFRGESMLGLSGLAATAPLHLRNLRGRMAVEIAGGPAASVLTAFVAFCLLTALPGSAWEPWWRLTALVAVMSAASAVLNLVPFGVAAGCADGALLLQLFRRGRYASVRQAMKLMSATLHTPIRPRELDPRLLAKGSGAGVGGHEEVALRVIELIGALDRGDREAAREVLDDTVRWVPRPDQAENPGVAAELTLYLAYLDGHAQRAAEWLRGVEEAAEAVLYPLGADARYWLAVAAVRRAEGAYEQAEEAWQRAALLLEQRPASGLDQFERELLDRVRGGAWMMPKAELAAG